MNFGRDQHFEHGIRYDRAAEFHDVVVGLWDSWEDDAFLRDKASGQLVRLRQDAHPQSQGEVLQRCAGRSTSRARRRAGRWWRRPARRTSAWSSPPAPPTWCSPRRTRSRRAGLLRRHARAHGEVRPRAGRHPHLARHQPIVGRTEAEAQEKYEELRALVDDGVGIAGVARLAGGVDIFAMDPDGPLPPLKPSNAARARQELIIAMGKRGMTIREIGRVLAMSQTHRVLWGTPQVDRRRPAGMARGRRLRRLQPAVRALSQAARGMGRPW